MYNFLEGKPRHEAPFGSGGGSNKDRGERKPKHEYKGLRPGKDNKTIIQAIEEFEKQRTEYPLQQGDVVASREDPLMYELKELTGDGNAVIGYRDQETGNDMTKVVPENTLFDVKRVKKIAVEIDLDKKVKRILKQQGNDPRK